MGKSDKSSNVKNNLQAGDKNLQLIVFRQGSEEYGIHIDQIKEVVLTPNITRMPQSSRYIKGVANVRGNIIAIIDLEEKFGLKTDETQPKGKGNYTLVVASDSFKVGILVTDVPNTLTISSSEIEESVNVVQGDLEAQFIKGIVKLDDRLIILIDIFKILEEKEFDEVNSEVESK